MKIGTEEIEAVKQLADSVRDLLTVNCWWSFFLNESGECWVYVYNMDTGERWLGGDETEWENAFELEHPFVTWSIGERAWLLSCDVVQLQARKGGGA